MFAGFASLLLYSYNSLRRGGDALLGVADNMFEKVLDR
jgi:hypothetical protein